MRYPTVLAMWQAAARESSGAPFIHYFDSSLTYADVDRLSDAFAALLAARGVKKGDRIATWLQNIPQAVIVLVAGWKLGAIVVPMNPMNRARELGLILGDATPCAIVLDAGLYETVYSALEEPAHRPSLVFTTTGLEFQNVPYARFFSSEKRRTPEGAEDLLTAMVPFSNTAPPRTERAADDTAMLVYTSGTSGRPKGVITTQAGVSIGSEVTSLTQRLPHHGTFLVLSPLFHISGLVMSLGNALFSQAALVLSYRFDPRTILDAIAKYSPDVSSGATTAFIALMNEPSATREILNRLRTPLSGGAPVPAAVVEDYARVSGRALRTGYGLTETTGSAFLEPFDEAKRVDPSTGSLSVGKLLTTYSARIIDDAGHEVATGEPGEVVISGPAVSPGYWQSPEATAAAMQTDGLHTGDIGFLDADGWLYLVDRKSDVINTGGFKVWPREVEDVLYSHPGVKEVAVVAARDAYRGETVKAFVSLREGHDVAEPDLIAFCKERLAAYKYPRVIEVLPELPKTTSGKILRRELRGR